MTAKFFPFYQSKCELYQDYLEFNLKNDEEIFHFLSRMCHCSFCPDNRKNKQHETCFSPARPCQDVPKQFEVLSLLLCSKSARQFPAVTTHKQQYINNMLICFGHDREINVERSKGEDLSSISLEQRFCVRKQAVPHLGVSSESYILCLVISAALYTDRMIVVIS